MKEGGFFAAVRSSRHAFTESMGRSLRYGIVNCAATSLTITV